MKHNDFVLEWLTCFLHSILILGPSKCLLESRKNTLQDRRYFFVVKGWKERSDLCNDATRIWCFVAASWHFTRHKVVVHGLVAVAARARTDSGAFPKGRVSSNLSIWLWFLVHGIVFDESD